MKSILFAVLIALPGLLSAQYTYDKLTVSFLDKEAEAKAYTYGHLRLYPIRATQAFKQSFRDVGNYMTLREAIEKKKVAIKEKGDGGTVNTLTIENISNDTIIVITGEVVKGGKQDRIINQDMLLKPKSGKKDLPVYCVEAGRWSSGNGRAAKDEQLADASFNSHYKVGSMSLRKVVEKEKDQQKVWSKVEEINTANKTTTASKTYTALTNSSDFNKKVAAYRDFFMKKFAAEKDLIGVVVVSGDKVLGCDMFATPELFSKNFDNLLNSYITEAVVNGKPVTVKPAAVKAYMDQLLTNEKMQAATLKEKGNSFTEKGKKLRVSSFD